MYVGSDTIYSLVQSRELLIDPFNSDLLRAASYVLRLSNRFRFWRTTEKAIDLWTPNAYDSCLGSIQSKGIVTLLPNEIVIASTAERVSFPKSYGGELSTLSHLARAGISTNLNATWVNPGFGNGNPTSLAIEIVNHNPNPVIIRAGMPVCHLRISPISGTFDSLSEASSVYEGRDPLAAPLLYEDFSRMVSIDE